MRKGERIPRQVGGLCECQAIGWLLEFFETALAGYLNALFFPMIIFMAQGVPFVRAKPDRGDGVISPEPYRNIRLFCLARSAVCAIPRPARWVRGGMLCIGKNSSPPPINEINRRYDLWNYCLHPLFHGLYQLKTGRPSIPMIARLRSMGR